MDDITIAQSPSETAAELSHIASAIRELKIRERKFKRVLKQHNKLSRTVGSLASREPKTEKPDKGWI